MGDKVDTPDEIIDGCIKAQIKLLSGFGGNELANKDKLKEAQDPMHFAISLNGEPTLYPRLGELIKRLHERGKTSFLVTNGMFPDKIKELIELPTQLYVSVDAPNEELFNKIDNPVLDKGWDRLMKTLKLLPELKTRTTLRFTIIKDYNMCNPEQWAEVIKLSQPMFIEVKAYMYVGASQNRLQIENMPRHPEIVEFSKKICKHCDYQIVDEKIESRVVLLMKEDREDRIMKFD